MQSEDKRKLLVIMAKVPEHGKVKTRLAKTVGEDMALQVYLKLLQHTHSIASKVDADKMIFYAGESDSFALLDYYRIPKTQQQGGDLGERMSNAFERAFAQGYGQVVMIGSDCYQLEQGNIHQAFSLLDSNEYVLGPAEDGGYYLLGMNTPSPELFLNKKWSTADVFLDTLLDIQSKEASYALLDTLSDVDEYDDLPDELRDFVEKRVEDEDKD